MKKAREPKSLLQGGIASKSRAVVQIEVPCMWILLTTLLTPSGNPPTSCWDYLIYKYFHLAQRHSECSAHLAYIDPHPMVATTALLRAVSVNFCRQLVSMQRSPAQLFRTWRNLNIHHCLGQANRKLSTLSQALQDERKHTVLMIHLPTKKEQELWNRCIHRKGLRKPQKPCRDDRRQFSPKASQ